MEIREGVAVVRVGWLMGEVVVFIKVVVTREGWRW